MKLSYYTIDDLRLGYDPEGNTGWRQAQFLNWRDALEQFRSLPDDAVKAFGISNGEQEVELVRRVSADVGCISREDVLVLDFLTLPLWKKKEGVIRLAKDLVSELDIVFCLAGDRLVVAPTGDPVEDGLDDSLKGKYLWPDVPDNPESAIRWLCLSGTGWVSPAELKRRYPAPEKTCCYPVITGYRADGVMESGTFVPLKLSYWQYKLLERRTKERLDHKKHEGGPS